MANECLVTRLKGVVDNSNLPVFGEIKSYIVDNISNPGYGLFASKSIRPLLYARATKDTKFVLYDDLGNNPEEFTELDGVNNVIMDVVPTGQSPFTDPGEIMIDMYRSNILFGHVDTSKVYSASVLSIVINPWNGNQNPNSSINNISKRCPNLMWYEEVYSSVSGNIIDFTGCVNIIRIRLNDSPHVIGDIKNLAEAQSSLRNSGSLEIISNNKLTLDGTLVGNNVTKTINYGSSMVNPTAEESQQGYQIV